MLLKLLLLLLLLIAAAAAVDKPRQCITVFPRQCITVFPKATEEERAKNTSPDHLSHSVS